MMELHLLSKKQTSDLLEQIGMAEEYYRMLSTPRNNNKVKESGITDKDVDDIIKQIDKLLKKSKSGCTCGNCKPPVISCCAECGYSIVSDVPIEVDGKIEQISYCKFKRCMVLALGKVCGYEKALTN